MPISIPIEMEIEVTVLGMDEDELYQDTKTLLSHFDLTKVKDMKDDKQEKEEAANRKLQRKVRKGYEFRGVDITVSNKLILDSGQCWGCGQCWGWGQECTNFICE